MALRRFLVGVFVSALTAVLAVGSPGAAGVQAAQAARRGCCSHHHGVCGCSDSSLKCCDGTLSPTCTCNARGGEEAACAS